MENRTGKIDRFFPMRSFLLVSVGLLCALGMVSVSAEDVRLATANTAKYVPSPEGLVTRALQEIRASRTESALASLNKVIAIRPDFRLAYLIKGDLLLAKSQALPTFGAAPAGSRQSLSDLKDEARVRLMRYIDQPSPGSLPRQILQLAPNQKYALLADASRARLFVFENVQGEPQLIRDYYVSVGRNGVNKRDEGDKKTPVGVYTLAGELPRQRLTSFYGAGALPLNYPNEWDVLHGRSGHGIWLHGVPPDTYSRPPKTSDGCLVVSNPDYEEIARLLRGSNTPILIAESTDWVDRATWLAQRQDLLDQLESWKADWQQKDVERYLGHYSNGFLRREGASWIDGKRRNISQKDWIHIGLSDVSLFLYPGNDLAVITLTQSYDSDKHRDVSIKRLYLKLENGDWRIDYEKTLQTAPAVASSR